MAAFASGHARRGARFPFLSRVTLATIICKLRGLEDEHQILKSPPPPPPAYSSPSSSLLILSWHVYIPGPDSSLRNTSWTRS